MDKLPKGWESKKLIDCIELINGRAYKQEELLNAGTPVLRIQNLNGGSNWYYSNLELPKKNYCYAGELLFAWSASFGPYIWNGEKAIFHYHIWKVISKQNINEKFAYYFLEHFTKEVRNHTVGVAMFHITKSKMEQIPIYLPPLSEQTHIVSKLDALFARIDKSIALLEENIKHTKGLMASVLEEVFRDAANNWKFKRLNLATSKIGSGSTPRGGNDSYKASGISLIRSMNVYDGEFRHTGLAFIDDVQAQKLANVAVQKDDVLLNITGASVARCSIVDESILPARVNQHVSIIRPTSELNPHFLQAYLISPATKAKLLFNSGGGATREAITKSMIENLEVPIPDIKVQERIINHILKVKEVNSKIMIEQQSKLIYLKALKSSLLDRAFKGEL